MHFLFLLLDKIKRTGPEDPPKMLPSDVTALRTLGDNGSKYQPDMKDVVKPTSFTPLSLF